MAPGVIKLFAQLFESVFVASKRKLLGKYLLVEGLSATEAESKERHFGLDIINYKKSDSTHPEVTALMKLLKSISDRH